MPHRIAVNHWSWRMCILKGPISNAFACRSFLLFMLRHPSLILHFRPPLTWGRHMWVRSLCIKFWNEVIPSAWHERGQHRGEKGTFLFCHLSPQRILGMLYLLFSIRMNGTHASQWISMLCLSLLWKLESVPSLCASRVIYWQAL